MIQRINLIEKKTFSFTYATLTRIAMVIVLLNVLFGAIPWIQAARLRPQIRAANEQFEILTEENRIITTQQKKPQKKKVSIGEYQQLFDRLQALPKWSKLVKMISSTLPNSVWINSFKSVNRVKPRDEALKNAKKQDGKTEPLEKKRQELAASAETLVAENTIEISGVGNDIRGITDFAAKLGRIPAFKNLRLIKTERENFGYVFMLQGEVVADYVE